jgi:DNA-binding MarR family transcriptional regulator
MPPKREELVRCILKLSEDIYNELKPSIPADWLSSDLTVAQLRVMLALQDSGPSRMSSIASMLNIALPTATGIVDNLVRKGLAVREADSQDRRLVICKLSTVGQKLINKLWSSGQFQMENLLDGLTLEQLEKAAEVARMLFDNVSSKTDMVSRDAGL